MIQSLVNPKLLARKFATKFNYIFSSNALQYEVLVFCLKSQKSEGSTFNESIYIPSFTFQEYFLYANILLTKKLPRKMKSRFVMVVCAGYIFRQFFSLGLCISLLLCPMSILAANNTFLFIVSMLPSHIPIIIMSLLDVFNFACKLKFQFGCFLLQPSMTFGLKLQVFHLLHHIDTL